MWSLPVGAALFTGDASMSHVRAPECACCMHHVLFVFADGAHPAG